LISIHAVCGVVKLPMTHFSAYWIFTYLPWNAEQKIWRYPGTCERTGGDFYPPLPKTYKMCFSFLIDFIKYFITVFVIMRNIMVHHYYYSVIDTFAVYRFPSMLLSTKYNDNSTCVLMYISILYIFYPPSLQYEILSMCLAILTLIYHNIFI